MGKSLPEKEQPETEEEKTIESLISRREFLKTLSLALAGSVLAACAEAQEEAEFGPVRYRTATPSQVLQSPQPPEPEPTTITPELASFLVLSSLLTGIPNLNPRLGQIYMESLQNNPDLIPVTDLFQQAGIDSPDPPESLEELEAMGIFDQENNLSLANRILELWYTGVVSANGEEQVVTFVDSLTWKVIHYTKPPTICGDFGFWATKPPSDVGRS